MRKKKMKHRDLLGITVNELMDNYVHVYMEQDGDYGYYVGIIHIDDVNNILKRAAGQLIIDQDSVSKFWDLAHSAIVAGLPFTGR